MGGASIPNTTAILPERLGPPLPAGPAAREKDGGTPTLPPPPPGGPPPGGGGGPCRSEPVRRRGRRTGSHVLAGHDRREAPPGAEERVVGVGIGIIDGKDGDVRPASDAQRAGVQPDRASAAAGRRLHQ